MSAAERSDGGGWARHLDKKSGKYYFHNKLTGETVWKRPIGYLKKSRERKSEVAFTTTPRRNVGKRAHSTITKTTFREDDKQISGGPRDRSVNTSNPLSQPIENKGPENGVELIERHRQSSAATQSNNTSGSDNDGQAKSDSTGDKSARTSAWKSAGSDIAKKAKRAMRKLQMMQRLKKQKENIRENVLDAMDAISYTARNFRHRARDIVNIANLGFLVIALGMIISVCFSSGRRSIDSSMSYIGIREVENLKSQADSLLKYSKGTVRMVSFVAQSRGGDTDLDDVTTAFLFGALSSNAAAVYFEVNGLGAMRGGMMHSNRGPDPKTYVWSTHSNGTRGVRSSDGQGQTFSSPGIDNGRLEKYYNNLPKCENRLQTANKSCIFTLVKEISNSSYFLHCCNLVQGERSSMLLSLDSMRLNGTVISDDDFQNTYNFQETHSDKSLRIILYDASTTVVASSVNDARTHERWCDSGVRDEFLRESYRRISAMYDRECQMSPALAPRECSESDPIVRDLITGPWVGCLKNTIKRDVDMHIFKSRVGETGAQLKLTYGQDSKIDAYRLFIDSFHQDVEGGLAVLFSEVAFQSSFGYGMLVVVPVVSAFLLLMSFGCSHLSLSLLGYDNKKIMQQVTNVSSRRLSILQPVNNAKNVALTFYAATYRLFARWWILLILFSAILAAFNAFIMGRGWGISMLTCQRNTAWKSYQGWARALSTMFRIPVAWLCWKEMWPAKCSRKVEAQTGPQGCCSFLWHGEGSEHRLSRRFLIGLASATTVGLTCEFLFGYFLDDDGVGYEQRGVGVYIALEIFTVVCYFAILPFVCRCRYSTQRKTDVELVDSAGAATNDHLFAESRDSNVSVVTLESSDESLAAPTKIENQDKDAGFTTGWDTWSKLGVATGVCLGIHVVVTALIESSAPTAEAGKLHSMVPPQLTISEISRVCEVLWFFPLLFFMLMSMRGQPDAHSHTAFGLLGGFFSCLFPFILGRSFLFCLVWFKRDITGWFQFVSEFGLYFCYMVFAALVLECFRLMALVASSEESVELAMAHCFVFQVFDCCFLNFMFIKLSPLSTTFLLIVAIRGFAAVARGSGQFVNLGYKIQLRFGIMPDILKRPVLTLYTDLRWAHQSLLAEIISMTSVLVAVLSEFMYNQCDSTTGLISEEIRAAHVYPVLTQEFSCAQTISLLVSNFIVLVVMVVALVFSTSIWHHKFKAMEKVMERTLDAHKRLSIVSEAESLHVDDTDPGENDSENTLNRTLSTLHKREMRVKKLLRVSTKESFENIPEGEEDTSVSTRSIGSAKKTRRRRNTVMEAQQIATMASNRLKAMTHIRRDQQLWNLREAIDVHYGRYIILYVISVGYAVCYSMQTVVRVNEDLRDLSTHVTFTTSQCAGNTTLSY